MESKMKIALCGGDARLLSAASLFAKNGYGCAVWKCAPGDCGGAVRCHELRHAVDGISAVILPEQALMHQLFLRRCRQKQKYTPVRCRI